MNRTRLEQIENIYQAVIDSPPDGRRALLDESCGGDKELRREVESLLRYDDKGPNFLDSPPALVAAEMFADEEERSNLVGKQINHYNVERLLGEGGMGKVYLAEDTRLRRRVALKVFPQSVVNDERLIRFEREAQAASALNHPNILTVYEFGDSDGINFLAAEFVEGLTLRHKLLEGPFALADAIELAIQICSALSAAHEAGITHRDIKPENIMVRRDGYVKVLDFGLAKLSHSDKSSTDSGSEDPTRVIFHTEPGVVLGTDAYMSPEQARGRRIDARTDIWSLGVVVYEMLAGQRPFLGETRADVIVALLSTEPPPLSTYSKNIPAEIVSIVSKALSKDVDGRYQTAKELRSDLIKIKKRLELHESMGESELRDPRTDAPNAREKIHSTIETGLRTSKNAGGQAADEDNYSVGAPSFWSSSRFASVLGKAPERRFVYSFLALSVAAIISVVAYFGFIAPKASDKIDSIAVLPFENLGGNGELAYAADGLSNALIDRFSQLPQLKVISRNSSMRFRGPDVDVRNVASQLGVRAIVTGSVQRIGDDIVVRVDVVDATENRQLGGAQYRRKVSDLEEVRNDIVRATVEQIKVKLTDGQSQRLTERNTENSEAYRYYLNGLVAADGTPEGNKKALEYFEKAVELDPEFALPYAEIAFAHWNKAIASSDPNEQMQKAKAAVEKALELDGESAKAHTLRAMVYESEFDWVNAEREHLRAIELSPNLDFARNNYAFFLSVLDRQDEALAQLEEQRSRDPLNQRMHFLQKGIVLIQARRFDEAFQAYSQAQTVEPSKDVPDFILGYAYAGKGQHDEAVTYYKKSLADIGEKKYSQPLVYLAISYAKMPEKRDEARAILTRIENMNEYVSPALLAAIYASLDDNDKAVELLERAYVKRDLLLRFIKTGYEYDGLRNDPRFVDLMRRIGFN